MTDEEVLAEFRAAGALLEGHFILSSGRRSANYLQCARVLMSAERAGRLALAVVQKLPRELRQEIDLVVSPAMGGLIIGHEVGRARTRYSSNGPKGHSNCAAALPYRRGRKS